MASLNPTPDQVKDKVPALREAFKKKYADNISKGVYDQRDLDRIEKDDPYARCFLRTLKSKGDVDKAADVMDEAFKFRKEQGIWDLTDDSFPKEIWDRKGVYYQGKTKDGYPVLYFKTKENNAKNKEEGALLRKFIAYQIEQHHRKDPEQFVVALFDMSGAGLSNFDKDVSKYCITCFAVYFPGFLAYMLNYEMPTLLSAAWTLVSAFLSQDQKGKVIMTKQKDIGKYLDDDNLWPHMKKGD